ncbi:hypothetical protein DOY81_000478 [Sarcophaga bullata]|nr:hypothetical protein DOY81_000478 [Sarcophaga bullata]
MSHHTSFIHITSSLNSKPTTTTLVNNLKFYLTIKQRDSQTDTRFK